MVGVAKRAQGLGLVKMSTSQLWIVGFAFLGMVGFGVWSWFDVVSDGPGRRRHRRDVKAACREVLGKRYDELKAQEAERIFGAQDEH